MEEAQGGSDDGGGVLAELTSFQRCKWSTGQ